MKRMKKILFSILALLLVGTAAVAWWQRDNLKALKDAVQYSPEELEERMQANQQVIQDAVNAAPEVVIRDVTEEEREALKEGTLTQAELVDRLTNTEPTMQPTESPKPASGPAPVGQSASPPAQQVPPETTSPEKPVTVDPQYQEKLSAIIAEVYVLREQYTIELDNMYESAKKEYKAMPKSRRTTEKLSKWAMGYVSQATQLEKNCDASMDDVVERMEALIKANNGDLSLVDKVVYTYANEKSLKKAFYMSMLEEKGLI